MNWTAIVPLKEASERKSRLAARLSATERLTLSSHMAAHVLACLGASPFIGRIVLLSPIPVDAFEWRRDEGRGLNEELAAASKDLRSERLLVIHADLPLLKSDDVDHLLETCGDGIALAADRHGLGTNAIAIGTHRPFRFSFGIDSAARHRRAAGEAIKTVQRPGLAFDVDTPDDLDAAMVADFGPRLSLPLA